MARFKAKGGNIQKSLGWWICRLAARVAAGGLGAAQRPRFDPGSYEKGQDIEPGVGVALTDEFCRGLEGKFKFDESLPSAEEQGKRADAAGEKEDITYVQFHFDRTLPANNDRGAVQIVNVVVPDMSSKLITKDGKPVIGDDGEPCLDLKSVAEECFGMVVYSTCQD